MEIKKEELFNSFKAKWIKKKVLDNKIDWHNKVKLVIKYL